MSKFIRSALLATVTAVAAAGAQAASASFDFYHQSLFDNDASSLSFSSNGIGLDITPVSTSSSAKVTSGWAGIGMRSSALESGDLNSSLLHTPGDAILLTFSEAVTLDQVDFSLWEGNSLGALDKATITSNGQTYAMSASLNDGGFEIDHFGLTGLIPASKYFLIQAQGSLSDFRLAGISVTSAVPEADTLAMFGIGMLTAGLLVRRRQSSQA